MSMSTLRRALGVVKDQTSISIAKVSGSSIAPDLDVAIVRCTSHDDDPAEERHIREVLRLSSYSASHASACVLSVSRRLSKTRDWLVALKSLILFHRLLVHGDPALFHELTYASRGGARVLNLVGFRDEAHSNSWDHSAFVRSYALYLDQRLELAVHIRGGSNRGESRSPPYQNRRSVYEYGESYNRYSASGSRSDPRSPYYARRSTSYEYSDSYTGHHEDSVPSTNGQDKTQTPVREMQPEKLLARMTQLQQLLDRFLACRPTGNAKYERLVLIALYGCVKESFQLYADICEVLAVMLDKFFDMEYADCAKVFDSYSSAAKQISELCSFYGWCKEVGVARSSEYPEVQKITDKLLETLEEFMRDRRRNGKSPVKNTEPTTAPAPDEPVVEDINAIKALPAPEGWNGEVAEPDNVVEEAAPAKQLDVDLVDLREDAVTADEQGNRLALALFSGPPAAGSNASWEAFTAGNGDNSEISSAWQTPAAEPGKADWELVLVETASNLSKQKAALAGGFDPLLLNGMYDQGTVNQHVSSQAATGSASSVALPLPGRSAQVLALPAPDGSMKNVGGDPFAASLNFPPPSYVQMADMDQKQTLLVQERHMWNQYQKDGMQGQASYARLDRAYNFVPNPTMPYGMPMPYTANVGYYHPAY